VNRTAFSILYDDENGEASIWRDGKVFMGEGALMRADVLKDALEMVQRAYDAAVQDLDQELGRIALGGDGAGL
jgi:hypothetical protein